MSELEGTTQTPAPRVQRSAFNIYAVLMVVSFVALATAVSVMWTMNAKLTGVGNPLTIVK